MLKKRIKYTDYFGEEQNDTFYFNLNKAELLELETRYEGGFSKYLDRVSKAENNRTILEAFTDIIKISVGEISEDGKRFIKNEEVTSKFLDSEAFSELIFEFMENADAAAEFARGILPNDLMDRYDESQKATPVDGFRPGHEPNRDQANQNVYGQNYVTPPSTPGND